VFESRAVWPVTCRNTGNSITNSGSHGDIYIYKVVQIWPGQTVTCLHTNRPDHIWTTLYIYVYIYYFFISSRKRGLSAYFSGMFRIHNTCLWKNVHVQQPLPNILRIWWWRQRTAVAYEISVAISEETTCKM
jgi:hypothetical protein